MDRLACVNVAALPLQILLRIHPSWAPFPVVVVEDDRPQALVLHGNARAGKAGIRTGQRYATALALASDLRAGTISPSQIEETIRTVSDHLRRYSPGIEPATDMPGVFWLDAHGLKGLYPSLHTWADAVRAELRCMGMRATVAVGFSRFGVYALAMSHRRNLVCEDISEEQTRVRKVPLDRLHIDPEVRDRLLMLGITTVDDFLRLPSEEIRLRFGAAMDAFYQLAAGQQWAPLLPLPAEELHERSVHFDAPESNAERLLFVIKRLLDGLMMTLVPHAQAVTGVTLRMRLDDRSTKVERVRSAAPTIEVAQLLDLIYLRLHTLQLSAGIVTLHAGVDTCPATPDQRRLFSERRRDADAANQALARVRAECGENSVVRAHLCDAHLPAARFVWEPLAQVPIQSAPQVVASRPLVRRIYTRPPPLTAAKLRTLATHFSSDVHEKPKLRVNVFGPYVLSGGWWGGGVRRDYYFAHTGGGKLYWLYYDYPRQRYFLQGRVE